jgi:hypothetical protein
VSARSVRARLETLEIAITQHMTSGRAADEYLMCNERVAFVQNGGEPRIAARAQSARCGQRLVREEVEGPPAPRGSPGARRR